MTQPAMTQSGMSDPNQVGTPQAVVETPQQQEYFGFQPGAETQRNFIFPDGITFITVSKLNEGGRKAYEKAVRGDITLERSGNARLQVDPSRDRHALLVNAAIGWNLIRGGQPVPFTKRAMEDWLELTDPEFVEKVAVEARKINKWLEAETTIEDIDIEIENLTKRRAELKEQLEGEASSSSR